ncbi:hypothetical protein BH24ACT9_BH24ACT9_17290 [soil metagenome]
MSPVRRSRTRSGRSPAQRLGSRAVFAVSLLVFLIIGMSLVGDFSAQWWLLLLPVALLTGPVLALRGEAGREPRDGQSANTWGR